MKTGTEMDVAGSKGATIFTVALCELPALFPVSADVLVADAPTVCVKNIFFDVVVGGMSRVVVSSVTLVVCAEVAVSAMEVWRSRVCVAAVSTDVDVKVLCDHCGKVSGYVLDD